jgi:hypothetical protein
MCERSYSFGRMHARVGVHPGLPWAYVRASMLLFAVEKLPLHGNRVRIHVFHRMPGVGRERRAIKIDYYKIRSPLPKICSVYSMDC